MTFLFEFLKNNIFNNKAKMNSTNSIKYNDILAPHLFSVSGGKNYSFHLSFGLIYWKAISAIYKNLNRIVLASVIDPLW